VIRSMDPVSPAHNAASAVWPDAMMLLAAPSCAHLNAGDTSTGRRAESRISGRPPCCA